MPNIIMFPWDKIQVIKPYKCSGYISVKCGFISYIVFITILCQRLVLSTARDMWMTNMYHVSQDRTVADELYQSVRVLCWVMTHPANHRVKAIHVKMTWGKRCNKLLFMSTMEDDTLPAVNLPVQEGRQHLWAKTKAAFKYVYENHLRDADWFLKADDDTYVVVENLRYMLSEHNPEEPIYFGCRYKPFVKQGYMSGGAGYVLSREALTRFVTRALDSPYLCKRHHSGAEDAEMGKCLSNVGVRAMDPRDSFQRGRFFPFIPEHHMFPGQNKDFWYWKFIYYPTEEGLDCCSDFAVSFHYVSPQHMHVLDYLIYNLQTYGLTFKYTSPHLKYTPAPNEEVSKRKNEFVIIQGSSNPENTSNESKVSLNHTNAISQLKQATTSTLKVNNMKKKGQKKARRVLRIKARIKKKPKRNPVPKKKVMQVVINKANKTAEIYT